MLKDRGTIKWTSLMLPEHVEMLKEIAEEDERQEKPALDEQELEYLNQLCKEAFETKQEIILKVYQNGDIHSYKGNIRRLNPYAQSLQVELNNAPLETKTFFVTDIVQIKRTE